MFDIEHYFSSQVPVKALSNPLLKYAACAYAAKQIGRVNGTNVITGGSCLRQAVKRIWPNTERVDWYYYGTKYYEKAIQLLMEELQHGGQSPPLSASEFSGAQNATSKRRKLSSIHGELPSTHSNGVLAATAILSAYELLDGTGPEWDRHSNGVTSLLDIMNAKMVLPKKHDSSENVNTTGSRRPRFSKARQAIFWNFARQEYLSACKFSLLSGSEGEKLK